MLDTFVIKAGILPKDGVESCVASGLAAMVGIIRTLNKTRSDYTALSSLLQPLSTTRIRERR